jgi:hypothetical protein
MKIQFCVVSFSSLKGPPIALNCLFCINLNCCYINNRRLELIIGYLHAVLFVQIQNQLGFCMTHWNMLLHGTLEHATRNTEDLVACFRVEMAKEK